MTTQQAILIGAGIIGASIVGAQALARYEFTPGVAANGNPFLWRSNRITGDIQNCQLELVGGRPVSKIKAAQSPTKSHSKFVRATRHKICHPDETRIKCLVFTRRINAQKIKYALRPEG
jgi:hypothetical protein